MNKLFSKIKNTLKWVVLGFVFLMQTACGNSYYSETFPLNFDQNKQVQNFEFELDIPRNQDKDKYHTVYLLMYFDKNNNEMDEFKKNSGMKFTNDQKTNLLFDKMKIKAILKDNSNNKIINEYESYMHQVATGAGYLEFEFPFFVYAMKKGRYTLSLSITQLEPFDYSKVQKMEIHFIQPPYK